MLAHNCFAANTPIIRGVNGPSNFALLKDYQIYLRVEKGLRPLTCEAYLSDLNTFAEFVERRVNDLDRKHAPRNLDNRRVVEGLRKRLSVDGRRCDDYL